MDVLLHCDFETGEPVGVWFEGAAAERACVYTDGLMEAQGRSSVVDNYPPHLPWAEICDRLARSSQYFDRWVWLTDADDPEDALEQARRRWAGVKTATSSSRWIAEARRERFRRGHAVGVAAKALGGDARSWGVRRKYPSMHQLFTDPSEERLVVVVPSGEPPTAIDAALATGLAVQGDRDLHVVLPDDEREVRGVVEPVWEATRRRLPFVCTPVRLWVHADGEVTAAPAPSKAVAIARTRRDITLPTGVHDLGDRADWVATLAGWADQHLYLEPAHRSAYLAWHADGRQVLKLQRMGQGHGRGIRVTAGIDYSAHREVDEHATTVELLGPLTSDQSRRIREAVERAIAARGDSDVEDLEAMLQARLATPTGLAALGLTSVLREVPATRPGSRRAFVDLLGADKNGNIHVIETKFGRHRMLGLQALDYWVWAVEHRAELAGLLHATGAKVADDPRILLDVVVGTRKDDEKIPDVRLLLPQLEALDGQISWRIGVVHGWRDPDATPTVAWHRRGQSTPDGVEREGPARFAWRMESHLRAYATARGESKRPPLLDTIEAGVIAPARPALQAVRAAGDAHRWLHHVRSSQAFALNLFGGLTEAQLVEVISRIDPSIVACDPPVFEYTDPDDELREATSASPHATQIDVRLDGRTRDGERHALLIEVKLSEDGFGGCSAAEAPANDRTDLCATTAPFGGDVDDCFQLRNHDREHRRRYDQYLPVSDVAGGNHACPYRELNQPMRIAALARVLVARGEADRATVVLCAHDDHEAVWRRWAEAEQAIPWDSRHRAADLSASCVVAAREPEERRELEDRYLLTQSGPTPARQSGMRPSLGEADIDESMTDDSTGAGHMRVVRTDPPRWLSPGGPAPDQDVWRELSADQAEWGFAIPQMYRVLASPDAGHEFLRAPREGDDLSVAAGYWSALLHLLTYSFGWIRPERGLLTWHLYGDPTDDVRLEMLARVWAADDMLDWFHAWTHDRPITDIADRIGELTGFVDDDEDSITTPGWADDQKDLADHSGIPAPCGHGGWDPLHLSAHLAGPLEEPTGDVTLVRTDRSRRRAVLLTDSMVGWYRALCTEGADLPDVGDRSWHVEVVVRSVGSLGVFRRSRVTGIWFSGPHRYHWIGIAKHTWIHPPPLWQP